MTNVATIPVYVIETSKEELQAMLAEKEKQLRKENENIRMFERLRVFLNTPEINKQLAQSRKRAERLEGECREIRQKLI